MNMNPSTEATFSFNGLPLPPPYHESPLHALALLSATLVGIHATGLLFDHLCYAGLVAQLLAGALLGPPLLNLWPNDWLTTFRMLGDLGLLLLVFSGGLSIDVRLLRKHLAPSVATALLGGALPIALAVVFLGACLRFPWIQAFTAGAALSSTSFGTTLVALAQADPTRHRSPRAYPPPARDSDNDNASTGTGTGTDMDSDTASTVSIGATPSVIGPLRTRIGTVLVAAAMLDDIVGLLLLSIITALAESPRAADTLFSFNTLGKPTLASFAILTLPPLLAALAVRPLARRCVPWILRRVSVDTFVYALLAWMMLVLSGIVALAELLGTTRILGAFSAGLCVTLVGVPTSKSEAAASSPYFSCLESVFNRSLGLINNWLLLPLFFLSMGTPLPIAHMFRWSILWQGLVFSVLMFVGKALVGPLIVYLFSTRQPTGPCTSMHMLSPLTSLQPALPPSRQPPHPARHASYRSPPAMFLGLGLVARGEVGIIMAQVAHASSLAMNWGDIMQTHVYLVAMWAILVCTVLGPVTFALFTRRHWTAIADHGEWGLGRGDAGRQPATLSTRTETAHAAHAAHGSLARSTAAVRAKSGTSAGYACPDDQVDVLVVDVDVDVDPQGRAGCTHVESPARSRSPHGAVDRVQVAGTDHVQLQAVDRRRSSGSLA